MNGNLNLKLDLDAIAKQAKKFAPTLVSLFVLGVFGYTGWVLNGAFNVKPAAEAPNEKPVAKVSFDKPTVETLKNMRVVSGQIAPTDVGKTDPFGN